MGDHLLMSLFSGIQQNNHFREKQFASSTMFSLDYGLATCNLWVWALVRRSTALGGFQWSPTGYLRRLLEHSNLTHIIIMCFVFWPAWGE